MSGAVDPDTAAPAVERAALDTPHPGAPRPIRVPRTLELAAAVSWRLLVVGAAVIATFVLLARLQVVFVSAAAAILVSCALWPTVLRLRSLGARPGAAALVTLLGLGSIVAVTVALVVPYAVQDVRELDVDLSESVDSLESWLVEGPLALSEGQAQEVVDRTEAQVRAVGNRMTRGAWDGAKLAVELVVGILLTLVLTFFFLKDGDRMWGWIRGFVPAHRRDAWNRIGLDVRDVLAGFLRGTTIVAAVDAVGIGLGLLVLGVPLVVPIALLTFVGGFVPLVGATIAGAVAVVIAFLTEGLLTALAVLALVLLVQQLEGNLLQPLVVGRSVHLHPAVILLAVGAGAVLWGIGGALLAVPITAAVATILAHVRASTTPEPVVVDER
jgi:putative heme transporter